MRARKLTAVISTLAILAAMLAGCGGSGSTGSSSSSAAASAGSSSEGSSSVAESSSGTETSAGGGIITVAYTTAWDSLMPYNSSSGSMWNSEVLDKLYDRLAFTDIGGSQVLPRGAASWESADDHMAIIFHLDENATWSDGEPVTANDWVYTVNLITNPALAAAQGSAFKSLAGTDGSGKAVSEGSVGVEALDDYTLKFTLKAATDPDEWLVAYNRGIYVLPEHILKDIPTESLLTDDIWTHPVGSGPLVYESEVIGSELVLSAKEGYQLGTPGFSKMVCTVMDASNTLNARISGDIDMVALGNQVNTDDIELAEASGLTVIQDELPTSFTEMLINNTNVDNNLVRQAMWYALDMDTITALMTDGYGTPADTYIMPGSEYENTDISVSYDPDHAKQLLDEAGYDGTVYTMACGSSREELVSLMQQYYDAIGFNMEIALVDVATMFSGMKDGTYDLGISAHTATANPLWFCTATSFYQVGNSSYSVIDTTFTDYFDNISATFDKSAKIELVKDFQSYIAEQVPFIPLWFSASTRIECPTVSGINYGASGMCNDNVWDWVKE